MRKLILLIVFSSIFFISGCEEKNSIKETKENRYIEIKKDFEKGLLWNLNAVYPNGCRIKEGISYKHTATATNLINQGYIKKEILLDVDGVSYCKAYADVDCINDEWNYKIYLKCNDYVDEGYVGYK